ncbi:MAG: hypothetical protein M0R70_10620 [Nitrospirae bacterium]|nr:hypothetical protein [Nitrospirota bacterium]
MLDDDDDYLGGGDTSATEDWVSWINDADSSAWEYFFLSPDDTDYRVSDDEVNDQNPQDVNWVQKRAEAMMAKIVWPTERQKEIMSWLSTSKFANRLKTTQGFYIAKGSIVRLKSGELKEIIDWLLKEGFIPDKVFPPYEVKYTPPGGKYAEKLTFFWVP